MKAEANQTKAKIANEARAALAAERNETAYAQKIKTKGLPKNGQKKILQELEMIKIATKCYVLRTEDKNQLANWLWEMTLEIGVRPYK